MSKPVSRADTLRPRYLLSVSTAPLNLILTLGLITLPGGACATSDSSTDASRANSGGSSASGRGASDVPPLTAAGHAGSANAPGASAGATSNPSAAAAGHASPSAGHAATSAGDSAADGGRAASPIITSKLVPAQGALLGHYYGSGTVADTDARIGRPPAIHLTYYAWEDDWASASARDLDAGKIPLVNWEPDGIDFNHIVSGALDATIDARASGAKKLGKPLFLDFAAEMNGDEAWSGNDAMLYVSAYRHIHDRFIAAGASNVVWAWCPNVTDVDGRNRQTMDYYPGDEYVDWTGVDGYNWGSGSGFSWQSFHDVFADIYPLLAAKNKPIIIGEMASDENGGNKAQWIEALVPTLRDQFPMIKAVVWFDVDKERHWEIDSSPATLAAYMHYANHPYMNP
jgi:hypothetical protein